MNHFGQRTVNALDFLGADVASEYRRSIGRNVAVANPSEILRPARLFQPREHLDLAIGESQPPSIGHPE
ncbi:hypothetical protein ACPOL_4760 [Acidisarcina polymorpha]|uniref:Uncharacterized protein n=1 Tax=Acidisarcina polymorpha TaxID=2211140 RepID=A0A2Z5G646_9BACT|nr:hypothetical protein ACPOL_4760 [Acidisarcina polymorpha]